MPSGCRRVAVAEVVGSDVEPLKLRLRVDSGASLERCGACFSSRGKRLHGVNSHLSEHRLKKKISTRESLPGQSVYPGMKKQAAVAAPLPAPRAWVHNGRKYWVLYAEGAEIVASIGDTYTPYYPPMHATYEIYSVKKGLSKFLGYLEGEQLARAHQAFSRAFARWF